VRCGAASATAERLLAEVRAEAVRADAKASVLIAALGVVAAALAGIGSRPRAQAAGHSAAWLACWWTGEAMTAVGFATLLAAVAPRRRHVSRPRDLLAHFADISRAAATGRLPQALCWTERHPDLSVMTAMTDVSRIVVVKYRWIRTALCCFAVGMPMLAIAATRSSS